MQGEQYTDELKKELVSWVRSIIGPIAAPDVIQWAPTLPKTRSGKIMRRILRKVACNEEDSIGDVSTLNEPEVVDDLIKNRLDLKVVTNTFFSQSPYLVGSRPERTSNFFWNFFVLFYIFFDFDF